MSEGTRPARLGARRRRVALALAEALLPAFGSLEGAGSASIDRLERMLAGAGRAGVQGYGALLDVLEHSTLASRLSRFSRLPMADRRGLLRRWLEGGRWRRAPLSALTLPLEIAHFDSPEFFDRLCCVYDHSTHEEPPAFMRQVRRAHELEEETIECDVAVVGTGAGGAVVAKELAEAGHAVVMLEEGEYRTRSDFTGRPAHALGLLYRGWGPGSSVGNARIRIPLGRCVGGSTTINSGTCFRTPDAVLDRWRTELGLAEFTSEHMRPYFDRVERELQVAEGKEEHLGGVARVIARGCDALGWSHHALRRNAPDCDGRGVCVFGCPTGSKRSTNVSYVPLALERSALLVTGLCVERLLLERGRVTGVEGRASGNGRTLRVRARNVVLACGTLLTPVLLRRQGLLRGSSALGRNLVIHPAVGMAALFEEPIRSFEGIPQGYCVDEFHAEGILLEGASVPPDLGAVFFDLIGNELMEVMEHYDRVASFGVMVSERHGGGRVRVLPGGRPLVRCDVSEDVLERLQLGLVRIGEIFLAAGARRLFPGVRGFRDIRSSEELTRLARARLRPRDLSLSAYHPLGTCRIGPDPATSVLDPLHRAHELPGLYVCDGSAVPTSPMVNPQLTIMAMATRVADRGSW